MEDELVDDGWTARLEPQISLQRRSAGPEAAGGENNEKSKPAEPDEEVKTQNQGLSGLLTSFWLRPRGKGRLCYRQARGLR